MKRTSIERKADQHERLGGVEKKRTDVIRTNTCRLCIKTVFHQFLDDGAQVDNDLPRLYLVYLQNVNMQSFRDSLWLGLKRGQSETCTLTVWASMALIVAMVAPMAGLLLPRARKQPCKIRWAV